LADFPISGAQTYIQCGKESTYGSAAAAITVAFGHNQKITVDRNMNTTPVFGLGSPYASKSISGIFEGRLTITFDLASTYFLELVMGACTDGGAAPYTHTYNDNTGYAATSFTVENGFDTDVDGVYKYLGCVVDTCEIIGRVGEAGHVTINAPYANETLATTGLDASPAADAEDILVFSEGSLQLPSGTTLARVQAITLRFVKNAEVIYGLGSRTGSKAIWKSMIFEFDAELSYENDDMVVALYGQATGPLTATNPAGLGSLVLTFTNGGAGAATRSLVITLTTTWITGDSIPQAVEEHVTQTVRGYSIGKTSIIGSDNTATNPL